MRNPSYWILIILLLVSSDHLRAGTLIKEKRQNHGERISCENSLAGGEEERVVENLG